MCLSTGHREGKNESFQGRPQNFKKRLLASSSMSVMSARFQQLRSHSTDFHEI